MFDILHLYLSSWLSTKVTTNSTLTLSFFNPHNLFLTWPSMSLTISFALTHMLSLSLSLLHGAHTEFHSNLGLLAINMCFVRPCRLCSATLVDLQLLSNTYCQASETCNLSFARRRPANSTRYINKKNDCCYACQQLVCVCVCVCVCVWQREGGEWDRKMNKKCHRRKYCTVSV